MDLLFGMDANRRYRVGFNKDGRLRALDVQLYNNGKQKVARAANRSSNHFRSVLARVCCPCAGGFSWDLSGPVMDRALFHTDNVRQTSTANCGASTVVDLVI